MAYKWTSASALAPRLSQAFTISRIDTAERDSEKDSEKWKNKYAKEI